jgi:hypothetical protein
VHSPLLLSNQLGSMQRDSAGMHGSVDALRHQMQHGHLQQQPGRQPDTTTAADARDQEPGMEQLGMELPITYMPFKFENRRVRIDWRLLHGVDIDKLVSRNTTCSRTHELRGSETQLGSSRLSQHMQQQQEPASLMVLPACVCCC